MKRFLQLLTKKFTLGLALSILATFTFAVFIKFCLESFFHLSPIRGGLTLLDVTYFFSIAA